MQPTSNGFRLEPWYGWSFYGNAVRPRQVFVRFEAERKRSLHAAFFGLIPQTNS